MSLSKEELFDNEWRPRTKGILATLLVLGVIGAIFARPIYQQIKRYRADEFAREGEAAVAAQNWEVAFRKAELASQMAPAQPRAMRIFATIYAMAGMDRAFFYWDQLFLSSEWTAADREACLKLALRLGRTDVSRQQLEALLKDLSQVTPTICQLAAEYFTQIDERAQAIQWLDQALHLTGNSSEVQMTLIGLLMQSPDAANRSRSRKLLLEVIEKSDPVALAAAEILIRFRESTVEEKKKALAILKNHPKGGLREKLLAVEFEVAMGEEGKGRSKELRQSVVGYTGAAKTPEELVLVTQWLNRLGEHSRVLELLPGPKATETSQVALIYLDAMAGLKKWKELEKILETTKLPVDPVLVALFQARVATELGQTRQTESFWNKVFSQAAYDPMRLIFVADYALKMGALDQAIRAYEQLTRFPTYSSRAYTNLLAIAEKQDDSERMIRILQKILEQIPDGPAPRNDLAYLQLLKNQEIDASGKVAEELVGAYPRLLSYRTTLALARLRQKDPAGAGEVYQGLEIDWETALPSAKAVYAAVLAGNGKVADAKKIIALIPGTRLKKEERELLRESVH